MMPSEHEADQDAASSSPTVYDTGRANYQHLVADVAWYGLAIPATTRFLAVYAIRLDAAPLVLGLLAALPAIFALATSSLTARWRRRFTSSVRALLVPGFGFRLAFLLPAFTPFFPAAWQPAWLVAAVALPALAQGIASVVFLVLLREAVDNSRLTSLMGRRSLLFNITVGLGTLAFGFWLEFAPFPFNYQMMFVAAFAASLISLRHVQQVEVLSAEPLPTPDHAPVSPWRSPGFQSVVFITILTHLSFFVIVPIVPLHLVDNLGADEAFMSFFAVAELSAAAIVAMLTNRLVMRIGSRMTITLGMAGTGVSGVMLALAPSLPLTLAAAAISGAAWTAAAIAIFGYFSENTPVDGLTRYSTVWNQVVMLSIFAGPMIGSQLASTPLGLPAVLVIGSVLRLAAAVLVPFDVLPRLRVPRRAVVVAPRVK